MSDWIEQHKNTVITGDCLDVMKNIPDGSVDLIATDPPYFKILDEDWDNKWSGFDAFADFIDSFLEQSERVLAPNGSLYFFCSPRYAARLEVLAEKRLHVLNNIVWDKGIGRAGLASPKTFRAFFPTSERIILAEKYNSDNMAKGEAGYQKKCDELRGSVFEPLRKYLDDERKKAGVTITQIKEWFAAHGFPKYVTARHSFCQSQFELPTEENYLRLRQCFRELGKSPEPLSLEYEDLRLKYKDLRLEYEGLRLEYEGLRRPFFASPDSPYTDVWKFASTPAMPGRHPCKKPIDLMTHIVKTSTRQTSIVLDPFCGSGSTLVAAKRLGLNYIGIELDPHWAGVARRRLEAEDGIIHDPETGKPIAQQCALF